MGGRPRKPQNFSLDLLTEKIYVVAILEALVFDAARVKLISEVLSAEILKINGSL